MSYMIRLLFVSIIFAIFNFCNAAKLNSKGMNECLDHIKDHLVKYQEMSWLTLSDCQLVDADMPLLLEMMYQLKFEGQAFLNNNQISSKGAIILSQYTLKHSYNLDHNPIGNEGLMSFLNDQYISWLYLGKNQFDDATANKFIQDIEKTNLNALQLRNVQLTSESLYALAKNRNLKVFGISDAVLSDDQVNILTQSDTLRELALVNDSLTKLSLSRLAKNPHLDTLYLSKNNIDDDGAIILAASVSLKSISLNNNRITAIGLQHLLENNKIFSLNLANNAIEDTNIQVKTNNEVLQSLVLDHNKIGDKIAQALSEHIPNLDDLYLDDNLIGDNGFYNLTKLQHLMELSLRHNLITQYLQPTNNTGFSASIDLGENNINDDGFKTFLSSNLNTFTLVLDHNQIGDEGAIAYSKSSYFGSIDLSFNNIGDAGARAIAASAMHEDLLLSHNNIADEGAIALANPAKDFNVTKLDISYNKLTSYGVNALRNSAYKYWYLNTDGNF